MTQDNWVILYCLYDDSSELYVSSDGENTTPDTENFWTGSKEDAQKMLEAWKNKGSYKIRIVWKEL